MCFTYSLNTTIKSLENRFKRIADSNKFKQVYSVNGFTYPEMPVITNTENTKIDFYKWGLIPGWVKDDLKASEIKKFTLNARSETIFEKPSYKDSIHTKRCLIPATGYFEWYHTNKKKYPFLIYLNSETIFSFAGIWSEYMSDSKDKIYSFSIVTVDADSFTSKIHNSKKRMPLLLKQKDENNWLNNTIKREEIEELLIPGNFDFNAYSVNKILGNKKRDSNIPEILLPYDYDDLKVF